MNSVAIGKANGGIDADRTRSGKEHFEVLDGLRGSAAFLIVIFHSSIIRLVGTLP